MINLYLDASRRDMIIILEINNKIIKTIKKDNFQQHSENFIPTIFHDFLKPLNLKANQIDNLYITSGPGSFVGVRVLMVFAKTLKLIHSSVNIFVISTLLAQINSKEKTTSIISISASVNYLQNFINYKPIDNFIKYDYIKLDKIIKKVNNPIIKDFQVRNFVDIFVQNCKTKSSQIMDINNLTPVYFFESW